MTKLSVNINKIATIRNARGGTIPNLVEAAIRCEEFGADGITVHPRPDERHIRKQDVYDLKPVLKTEYNIEGYPNERFMEILKEIRPTQATLVPDGPAVLTSDSGWDTIKESAFLMEVISRIRELGIRTSIFMETDSALIEQAAAIGCDRVEFYTGPYAEQYDSDKEAAVYPYIQASKVANEVGLGINAGHDLSLKNLKFFKNSIPSLLEVSIGHALISDSLYLGLENTISLYKGQLAE
jgi:pyridoxine 5-phosphate synthase